jgi:hypothetical protein
MSPLCSASFQEQAEMLESQAKFEAERLSQQIFTVSGDFSSHFPDCCRIRLTITRVHRVLGRSREKPLGEEGAAEKGSISIQREGKASKA